MARSIGEAAALGLQSGFLLARNTRQMERNNARQDQLDADHASDRAYLRARQQMGDKAAALAAQRKSILDQVEGEIQSGGMPSPERRRQFANDIDAVDAAQSDLVRRMGGVDLPSEVERGKAALAKVSAATDPSAVDTDTVARAVVTSTMQPLSMFKPGPNGEPPPIVQAGDAMMQGIQTGNKDSILKGANVLYAPHLQKGVGSPSPHGGTIVGKEFVDLVPAPGSSPDDPRFIPTVRVYVRDDAKAGDFARMDRANDKRPPGAQQAGATSYYDAPLTEDRSSSDGSKVKTIGLREAQNFMAKNVQVAQALNDPAMLRRFAEQPASFDDEAFLAKFRAAGGRVKSDAQIKHEDAMELERVKSRGRDENATTRGEYSLAGKRLTLQGVQEAIQGRKDVAGINADAAIKKAGIAASGGVQRATIAADAAKANAGTKADASVKVAETKAGAPGKKTNEVKEFADIHKEVVKIAGEDKAFANGKLANEQTMGITKVVQKAMAAGVPYNEALNGAIAAYKRANPKPGSDK